MANFLLTFYGGSMPESQEEGAKVMAAWTDWFGELGDSLIDGGNPISSSKAISPDGSVMDAQSGADRLLDHQGRQPRRGGRDRQGLPGPGRRRDAGRFGDLPGHVVQPRAGACGRRIAGGYAARVTQPGETHTATFLMTDIAGSTRLWEEQRDGDGRRPGGARRPAAGGRRGRRRDGRSRRPATDCWRRSSDPGRRSGRPSPASARSQDHAWPTTTPLLVRMAIHAGDAEVRNDDYFGPSLNRVARVLAIGHGGQVLVSAAAAALVADDLPAGATLLDRGEHHLKDLARPEHVYQLGAPGLATDFPPLRSGARRRPTCRPT